MSVSRVLTKIHNCDFINQYHTDETASRLVIIAHGKNEIRRAHEGTVPSHSHFTNHLRKIRSSNPFFSCREIQEICSKLTVGAININHLRLSFCAPQGSRVAYSIHPNNPSVLPESERKSARVLCSTAYRPSGLDIDTQSINPNARISNLMLSASKGRHAQRDLQTNTAFADEITSIEPAEDPMIPGARWVKTDVLYMVSSNFSELSLFNLLQYLQTSPLRPTQQVQYHHIILNVCNIDLLAHRGKTYITDGIPA